MVFHQLTFATKMSNRKSNYKRRRQKCSATVIINYLRCKYIITVIYQNVHYDLLWQIKNHGKSHFFVICLYLYILYVDYSFRNYSSMVMRATSPKCNTFYIISPLLQNDTIYATRQYVMQLSFNENLKW